MQVATDKFVSRAGTRATGRWASVSSPGRRCKPLRFKSDDEVESTLNDAELRSHIQQLQAAARRDPGGLLKSISSSSPPPSLLTLRKAAEAGLLPAYDQDTPRTPLTQPAFTRRREIWVGRAAMLGVLAACYWEVHLTSHPSILIQLGTIIPVGPRAAGWLVGTLAFGNLVAALAPWSPTYSLKNQRDIAKRPAHPLSQQSGATPKWPHLLGVDGTWGFSKANELLHARLAMLGFAGLCWREASDPALLRVGPLAQVARLLHIPTSTTYFDTCATAFLVFAGVATAVAYLVGRPGPDSLVFEQDVWFTNSIMNQVSVRASVQGWLKAARAGKRSVSTSRGIFYLQDTLACCCFLEALLVNWQREDGTSFMAFLVYGCSPIDMAAPLAWPWNVLDVMALRYAPTNVLVAEAATGHVMLQNPTSVAAFGDHSHGSFSDWATLLEPITLHCSEAGGCCEGDSGPHHHPHYQQQQGGGAKEVEDRSDQAGRPRTPPPSAAPADTSWQNPEYRPGSLLAAGRLDYVSHLFHGPKGAIQRRAMEEAVRAGSVYRARVQITSPVLLQLLTMQTGDVRAGLPGGFHTAPCWSEVWHEVHVCSMQSPYTLDQLLVLAQHDISAAVAAEKRELQLRTQQEALLQEILPQQVVDVLLGKDPVVEQADVATSPLYTSLRLALSQQQLETCPAAEATCTNSSSNMPSRLSYDCGPAAGAQPALLFIGDQPAMPVLDSAALPSRPTEAALPALTSHSHLPAWPALMEAAPQTSPAVAEPAARATVVITSQPGSVQEQQQKLQQLQVMFKQRQGHAAASQAAAGQAAAGQAAAGQAASGQARSGQAAAEQEPTENRGQKKQQGKPWSSCTEDVPTQHPQEACKAPQADALQALQKLFVNRQPPVRSVAAETVAVPATTGTPATSATMKPADNYPAAAANMRAAIMQQQESQQAAAAGASHGMKQQQELLLHKPTWSAERINTGAPATVLQLPAEPGLTVSVHGATHLPSNPSAPAACSATPDSLAQLQLQDHQLELQLQALLAEQRRVRAAMQELLQVAPTDRCCLSLPPPQACLKAPQTAAGAAGDGLVSIVSLDAMLGGHSELLPKLMQPSKAEKERELQDLLYNLEQLTMGRSGKAPPDGLHLRQSPPCTHLTADSPPTCEADEQSEHFNCTAGSKHLHGPQTLSSPQLSLLDTSRRGLDRSSPNLGHTPSQPSTFLLKGPGPCGARACSFELPSSQCPVPVRHHTPSPAHSARTPLTQSSRQHGLPRYHSEGRQPTGSRAATEGMVTLLGHWSPSLMGGSSRMARADADLSPGPRLVSGRATAPGAVPDTKAAAKVSSALGISAVGSWGDESILGRDFNGSMGLDPSGSLNNGSTSGPPISVMTSQWHEELMRQAVEGMHCSPDVDRALRGYARQARLADEAGPAACTMALLLVHGRCQASFSAMPGMGCWRCAVQANTTRGGVHLSTRDVMRLATWHEEVVNLTTCPTAGPHVPRLHMLPLSSPSPQLPCGPLPAGLQVTLLFADIKGFTSMAAALHPAQVMLFLNHLFNQFDDLLADHDVYKVGQVPARGLF
ncbi:hypothetical protein QJQ45_030398 [Haematococcus lacustris]|nr:hypothetical protein QJQ45_030398 [Haematococcus lacustris]